MAATFTALNHDGVGTPLGDLLRMPRCADGRHDDDAVLLQLRDELGLRRQRERRNLDPVVDEQLAPIAGIAGVSAQVDPERLIRAALDLEDRLLELGERHRRGGEDAQAAGVGRGRDEPRTGDPAHTGLDDRVPDADEVGQGSAELLVDHGAFSWAVSEGTSRSRRRFGSSISRITTSSA